MTIWEDRYETLRVSRRGRVLTVAMDGPAPLNAVGARMHRELSEVWADVAADPGSDVVVLTGTGRAFSAGGDIGHMQDMVADPGRFVADIPGARRIVFSLLDLAKPVVARINGHAAGLGATLALLCDVSFMAEDARIGDPHVAVGLVAGDGGAVIWPQLVGFNRAKEFLLTGDMIPAPRAAAMGLVNHCVPAAELDAAVDAFCDRLAAGHAQAIQWTKRTVNAELRRIAHALMDTGLAFEALTAASPGHAAAVAAFAARVRPRGET